REAVEQVPDRRSGEAVDGSDTELCSRLRRRDHLLGRTTAHALGIPVSPDVRGRDRRVAAVDRVADALADQMVADREDSEAVLGEERAHAIAVVGLGQRPTDIEMVAPACELEA